MAADVAMGDLDEDLEARMDLQDDKEGENEAEMQMADAAYVRQYENEHSWDQLQEDEHGLLRVDRTAEQRAKRRRLLSLAKSAHIRKGMIRYLVLVVDLSRSASATDLRPSRLGCMLATCRSFIREFFDQNPLSHLGVVVMQDGVATKLTELSASPDAQVKKLADSSLGASGDASLQNALDAAVACLKTVPPYGHREVLMLFAALSTCDPGDVHASIKACKDARIRVSVVGVAAEVFVLRRAADATGGTYGVALGESHLQELMMGHAPPPAASGAHAGAELVRMGFPQRAAEDRAAAVFVGPDARLAAGGFTCPRCLGRVAELPCECHVCGLTLISSPHLARSYHHLFPVAPYEEVPQEAVALLLSSANGSSTTGMVRVHVNASAGSQAGTSSAGTSSSAAAAPATYRFHRLHEVPGAPLYCFGCLAPLAGGDNAAAEGGQPSAGPAKGAGARAQARQEQQPMVLQCPACRHVFCFECDSYVHESLHNCPGCECGGGAGAVIPDG